VTENSKHILPTEERSWISVGTTARSPRYRWKEGKVADLREFVEGRVLQGASITQALKEYAERNRISWLTARWKYYQVRNQAPAEAALPQVDVEPGSREGDFLDYLQDLVRSTQESGQDIVPFIKGLARMAVLSRESTRLRDDLAGLRQYVREVARVIEEHSGRLGEWLERSQVDRVSSLKEFSAAMEEDLKALENLRERLPGA
jgi:hypothetical protein